MNVAGARMLATSAEQVPGDHPSNPRYKISFPAYMDDAALAVKWTFDNIAQHGGDPDKVFVMGHSAGAQLAALVAYDGKYLDRVGIDKRRIRGVVSLAGPLDFLPLTEAKMEFIFPLPVRAASQPINFVTGKEPPTLLLHGTADTRVGIHNSRNLATRIAERGGMVETTYYPGMSHIGIVLALAAPLRDGKPVFLIYRPHRIDKIDEMFDFWRESAHQRLLVRIRRS